MKKHKLFQRVVAILLFSSLFAGCYTIQPQDTPTLTPVDPTETLKPTISSTSIPSVTPRPTRTATPKPGWVTDFAEPILAAIADRPADVEEDFSQAGPGWYLETVNCPNNGCALSEGVLSVTAFPVDHKQAFAGQPLGSLDEGFRSFVMRVDVNTVKLFGENSAGISYAANLYEGIKFTRKFQSYFELKSQRRWFIWIDPPGYGVDSGQLPRSVSPLITYTLIVRGSRIAVYLNDIPVTYREDAVGQYQAEFDLGAWSDGSAPARAEYDNFKLWNLDNIPGLP